ncbi:MAG TPA: ABC transporter ATP-binding protein [Thermoanaerobaculaceae bacterium]|nr:ABC transporter ATP-binding protein [Thermoanaerobaculaceae bacterium]
MADGTILSAHGLIVRYGTVEAVKGLDLEVPGGQVIGLIGPDGAGKTSSLRVFAGLMRATAGTVEVLGRDAWRHRRALHHRLGYLAQRFALYGDLTVDENVRFFALLLGVKDWRARREMLLERVALTEFRDRQADRLSGGMRQKLALACSLMHSPDILLLDEPTTGVDPVTRREFWRLLADLVAEGLTLVIATPYLDEAERCSRVVLMHRGRVLADAPPAELRGLLPGVIVEVAAQPRGLVTEALSTMPGVEDVQPFAARFHVRLSATEGGAERIREALEASGATVEEVRVIPAGLEDTFLHLTHHDGHASGEAA